MKRQILISFTILLFIQTLAAATELPVPLRDYPTIQSAIDDAVNGDVVLVEPGVYTGYGNVDLDFLGKAITVKSWINPENPEPDIIATTIIDCGGSRYNPHRAFQFHNGEGSDSEVLGFTIINGYHGGQKLSRDQDIEEGVPFLSKIPLIGRAFRNRSQQREQEILLVLIRPKIILQEETEAEAVAMLEEGR